MWKLINTFQPLALIHPFNPFFTLKKGLNLKRILSHPSGPWLNDTQKEPVHFKHRRVRVPVMWLLKLNMFVLLFTTLFISPHTSNTVIMQARVFGHCLHCFKNLASRLENQGNLDQHWITFYKCEKDDTREAGCVTLIRKQRPRKGWEWEISLKWRFSFPAGSQIAGTLNPTIFYTHFPSGSP